MAIRSNWLYTHGDATRITLALDYSKNTADCRLNRQTGPGVIAFNGTTTFPGADQDVQANAKAAVAEIIAAGGVARFVAADMS